MNLCDSNHEELCYSGFSCPACDLNETIDELENEFKNLEIEKDELQSIVDTFREIYPEVLI